jgi:PadR family transcriptional regulator, regulatory protein PadR
MPDAKTCPCTGGTLDRLIQPAILVLLMEERMHGYRVAERIAGMPHFASQKPDMSGVYRSLKTMESLELVASSWDVSGSGPAKKMYELTESGEACLQTWIQTLADYRKSITDLLRLARRTTQDHAERLSNG